MLLTAEKIVMRDQFASADDYRAAAERRICSAEAAQGLPIVIGTDDTYG